MSKNITWILKSIGVIAITLLVNFPVVFGVYFDLVDQIQDTLIVLLTISALYCFNTANKDSYFLSIIIGVLAGYLISLLTWMLTFHSKIHTILTSTGISHFYYLGVLLPALVQFYLGMRKDISRHVALRYVISSIFAGALLIFILVQIFLEPIQQPFEFKMAHFGLGLVVGLITFYFVYSALAKSLFIFHDLAHYLRIMYKPILAFFLGYLLITFCFTGIYSLLYMNDNSIFIMPGNDTFADMLYYSFSIITGLGFSSIEPQKPVAFFFTTLENFLGLIWITVVFAAALAYLQAPFNKISTQLEKLSEGPVKENGE